MATAELDAGRSSSSRMQQPRRSGGGGSDESEGYDSSGSFDFGSRVDGQAEVACSAADELFFNGKILPLELAPRMAAMGIQQEQEQQDGRFVSALLRRGRSMGRSSTSGSGNGSVAVQPYTRKSSSYPPCGNKSSSIFRDLFGGGGSSSGKNSGLPPPQQQRPSKVLSSSKGLLKRVFANWSTSSSSSVASVTSVSSLPVSPSSSPARSMAQLQPGKRKPSAPTRRKAGELAPASLLETRSAPASPLSPHVRPRMAAGVSPILHLGGFKHHQQQQLSAPSYYPQQHRRKSIVAA